MLREMKESRKSQLKIFLLKTLESARSLHNLKDPTRSLEVSRYWYLVFGHFVFVLLGDPLYFCNLHFVIPLKCVR
jgi:hypothetical protein